MIFESDFNKFIKELEKQRDNYNYNKKILYTENQIRNLYDNLIRDLKEINTTGYIDVKEFYKEWEMYGMHFYDLMSDDTVGGGYGKN